MTHAEILSLINRSLVATLAYTDPTGRPDARRVFCTWHRGIGRHLISTNLSSSHAQSLLRNSAACLYFADDTAFEGLCLHGRAQVRTDREAKTMLWHPQDTMYYPGGIDDPDYCVIDFTTDDARYYRFDGKGDLTAAEIAEIDADCALEDGYAKTHGEA